MNYNFDEIVTRRGSNCIKWDEAEDPNIIPLWVADMDFHVYPGITEALRKRVEHDVFGYSLVPQTYYDAVIRWFRDRHGACGWQREHFITTIGVVPAVSAIIHALTLPGDKVLVNTPVYNCFFSSIRNQGCIAEEVPLLLNETSQPSPLNSPLDPKGRFQSEVENEPSTLNAQRSTLNPPPAFTIDWEAFERACADPKVRIFLLCNPHNPAGRVWTRDELQRMGEICFRHNVFVISDEIHCEFVAPGYQYTPFSSLGEEFLQNSATCVAASKAFNIAGLQNADIIVADPDKRYRIDRAINIFETCDVNPFGIVATEAAFTDGGAEWLSQLNDYVLDNYNYLRDLFAEKLPQLWVAPHEGTYLAWVDCSAAGLSYKDKVWIADGEAYGEHQRSFIRINLACPRATLAEGLRRIVESDLWQTK